MKWVLPVGLIVAFLPLAALAQSRPPLNDSARAMLGPWEFSNAARDKVCIVTFKSTRTAVGYKVDFDPKCASQHPLVASVAGWKYPDDDLLYLLDARGNALVEFSEVEDGIFEAPTPGVGVLFLQNPDAPKPDPGEPLPAESDQ